jgi:hypothetical protein
MQTVYHLSAGCGCVALSTLFVFLCTIAYYKQFLQKKNLNWIFTELLRALYDFTATDPKTLSFKASDQFVNLEKHTNIRKWWRVIDKNGHIGCIPCNYVTSVEVRTFQIFKFMCYKTN